MANEQDEQDDISQIFSKLRTVHKHYDLAGELANLIYNGEYIKFCELLDSNPDFNINGSHHGRTLLQIALNDHKCDFVMFLLKKGAVMTVGNNLDHDDVLFTAVCNCSYYCGYARILEFIRQYHGLIKYLLEAGANPNLARPNSQRTALMCVCDVNYYYSNDAESGMNSIVILLLDHRAKRELMDADGKTAEQLAEQRGNNLIAETLRSHESIPDTKGAIMEDM